MKTSHLKRTLLASSLVGLSSLAFTGVASALATPQSAMATNTKTAQLIIAKGDQEINRRLKTLATLTSKISASTKLTASDKSTLSTEVNTETSDLTALKTKLDAETTIEGARTDAQSVVSDYRVYALIVPKIQLIKAADDQQVTEGKLSDLATKLQTRLSSAQSGGKDVTALETKLSDMNAQTTSAEDISHSIESEVIDLQPSDYDSNHSVLSGDASQLKTAHADNQTAYTDAKAIVSGLKSL